MTDTVYWLWLQGAIGYGANVKQLFETFSSPKELFDADRDTLKNSNVRILTPKRIDRLKSEPLNKHIEICNLCKKFKIHIITPDSEFYPKALLDINNYPLALYVRGDLTCLNDEHTFAVIGSRTPSQYGEEAASAIVKRLSENGYLIVSGGALGIDTISHKSAMSNGGKTVLVMGCGHGTAYLPENSNLRKEVYSNGALITEYPPFYPVSIDSFPQRNRIISGMSRGVAIVEAAEYSGTFSTAKHALKQGRDLFVLPGDIKSGNFAGSNRLISEGAKVVFTGEEILNYYEEKHFPRKKQPIKTGNPFDNIDVDASSTKKHSSAKKKSEAEKVDENPEEEKITENIVKIQLETISKNALIVYNIVSDGVNELDEIVRASSLEVRKVLVALTELEMQGAVKCDGPNRYSLK